MRYRHVIIIRLIFLKNFSILLYKCRYVGVSEWNCLQDGIQTNQRGNPLRYELVPPQYLLKRQGYAVCRHCAINAHGTNERKSVNLFEHHNEESTKTKYVRQQINEDKQMKRLAF